MSEAAAPAGFSRMLSDERLTKRAVGGDERAFAAIFRRYHQSLYRFCLAIVGNPEDAQDALQNTMIKVLRALPGEERKIELKPWLYRIAHNESIDLLRRRRESSQLDVEQIAPGYGLAEDVETRERLRRLLIDLRELPERQREVLVLRELSGLDFEEIGAALETSGAVVRQTLYEARKSLHQMEEGREMGCDAVTRALSDGDGRVTRRRDVRAHLRSCASCRAFGDALEGRQQDLAALAPLSGVAAAGMLQGMLGGGSQAASGGGLAAALGGGAAKTIGASAAVKGLATVAVVAAVGVTAADRGGVIHLGLPGESGAKSGSADPGAGGPSHEKGSASEPGGGNVSGGAKTGEKSAAGQGKGEAGVGSGSDQGAHGKSQATEHGHQPAGIPAVPKAQGAPAENAGGHGQEKQPPQAAADGQETAAENKPPPDEGGTKEKDKEKEVAPDAAPAEPSSPPTPEPPGSPPKGPPANPSQGAAPSLPPQAQKPQSPPSQKTESPAPVTPGAPPTGHSAG